MRTGTGLLSRPGEHTEGTLTLALSQGERESYSDVLQIRFTPTLISAYFHGEEKKCEAIRRQNFSIPAESREEALRRLL